jgi:hypothetical protein
MDLMDQAALAKHPADVRFAGTSGSQAQCKGAQAPWHWTEWPCGPVAAWRHPALLGIVGFRFALR